MKKIEQYIKDELKDCPFTQEQEDKLLIGLTKFLDDLEAKQLNISSVSRQHKLLIAYEIEASKPYNASEEMVKPKVERIMKAINCL